MRCCCRTYGSDLEGFVSLHNTVRRGDLVGVKGLPGKTNKGELSIFAQSLIVLAPCLHMLPKHRLANQVSTCLPADLDTPSSCLLTTPPPLLFTACYPGPNSPPPSGADPEPLPCLLSFIPY